MALQFKLGGSQPAQGNKGGGSILNVITGVLVGLVLLVVGVYIQYMAANTPKLHVVFSRAVPAAQASPGDLAYVEGIATIDKTFASPWQTGKTYAYYTVSESRAEYDSDDKDYNWGSSTTIDEKYGTVTVGSFTARLSAITHKDPKLMESVYRYNGRLVEQAPSPKTSSDIKQELDGMLWAPTARFILFGELKSDGSIANRQLKGMGNASLFAQMSHDEAYAYLKEKTSQNTMIRFIIGAIAFFIGFMLIFNPISKIAQLAGAVVPFIGNLTGGIVFVVSLVLTLILSVGFFFLFKFWWLILLLVIGAVIAIIAAVSSAAKKKKA